MPRKLTTAEFIKKATVVHGDKYDYSKVVYVNARSVITIICPVHGEFEQLPRSHYLVGCGCVRCSADVKRSTTGAFIEKAKAVHGDKYDYSKVAYIGAKYNVTIICSIHGEFDQRATDHLAGHGCNCCGIANYASDTEQFIEKANALHGNKYDYSKVEYINNSTKVIIICAEHGDFEQIPNDHLDGHGCKSCMSKRLTDLKSSNAVEFIKKAETVHADKYDYSKVEYSGNKQKVIIICPDHGEFEQRPNNHIMSAGCPKCFNRVSKAEQKIIDFVSENYTGEIHTSVSPDFMHGKLELDIYLPEKNLAFEYNGNYWHDKKPKGYHRNKTKMCAEAGVELYHVWESDYNDNPEEIFELIKLELN